MGQETFNKLINIDVNAQSVGSLNKSLKEIDDEIKSIQENEIKVNQSLEEQEASLKKIAKLEESRNGITKEKTKLEEKSITSAEKTAKNLENQQKKAESLFKVAEGIGGSFQAVAGASLLMGQETSEALAQAQNKVMAIVSVTDGLKKVSEGAANGYKLVSEGIKKAEASSKTFGTSAKAAIGSTGIGLLVVALVLIVTYFDDITAAAKRFAESIGLDKIIDSIGEFIDSIGGLSGAFTVLGGVAEAVFKTIIGFAKVAGQIVKGLFTGNFDGVIDEVKKTSTDAAKAVTDAVEKAQKEAALQRLIKAKETAIKESEQEIAILKARGKDTLKLEEQLIKDRIALEDLRLKNVEKGSKAETEINDKKNAQLVAQEANKKAQDEKYFNDRLKALSESSNKEIFLVNKKIKDENKTTTEGQELLLLQQKSALDRELKIRKQHGEDVSALKLKQQQLDQQLEDNLIKQREEKLEKENVKEFITLQEQRLAGAQGAEAYADELTRIELDQLEDSIKNAEEGSKAQLDLQKTFNDKKIALLDTEANKEIAKKKELADKQKALDDYLFQQAVLHEQNILNNSTASFKDRIDANQNLNNILVSQNEKALKETETLYGKDSLEYKKLADQKIKIEEDFQKKKSDLANQQAVMALNTAQTVVNSLQSINNLANQITQNQIDESNQRIEDLNEKNSEIDQNISDLDARAQESLERINELETNLSDARGERSSILRDQLEEEKGQRKDLQDQQDKETKRKLENEKKIQKEKETQERLDKERKKRQQALDIITAVIQTALAVLQALATLPPPYSYIAAVASGVAGAAEIATISSQKYEQGGYLDGPSHDEGGIKGTGKFSNVEVEGGEFIVNKRATAQYRGVLESINGGSGVSTGKMAVGGVLPNFDNVNSITNTTNNRLQQAIDRPVFVSVQEFRSVDNRVRTIEDESTF